MFRNIQFHVRFIQVHVPQYSGPCSAIFRSMFRNIQVHVPPYSGPCSAIVRSLFRISQVHVPQCSGPCSAIFSSMSALFRSMFRNIQVHAPQYSGPCSAIFRSMFLICFLRYQSLHRSEKRSMDALDLEKSTGDSVSMEALNAIYPTIPENFVLFYHRRERLQIVHDVLHCVIK
jgi:hypothetical protein